jgi:hypothetical protein
MEGGKGNTELIPSPHGQLQDHQWRTALKGWKRF